MQENFRITFIHYGKLNEILNGWPLQVSRNAKPIAENDFIAGDCRAIGRHGQKTAELLHGLAIVF